MFFVWTCPRCSREITSYRRWRAHVRRPCDETIVERRRRAADDRASGQERPGVRITKARIRARLAQTQVSNLRDERETT